MVGNNGYNYQSIGVKPEVSRFNTLFYLLKQINLQGLKKKLLESPGMDYLWGNLDPGIVDRDRVGKVILIIISYYKLCALVRSRLPVALLLYFCKRAIWEAKTKGSGKLRYTV